MRPRSETNQTSGASRREKQAEEHQRLIIGELEHRTRNLFAVVQAVITNSLKDARTVAEASYVLGGRVKALSQAYAILDDAAWKGASLAQLLQGGLSLIPNASPSTVVKSLFHRAPLSNLL
jgi:two-component sensor histidine kinase